MKPEVEDTRIRDAIEFEVAYERRKFKKELEEKDKEIEEKDKEIEDLKSSIETEKKRLKSLLDKHNIKY